MDFIRELDLTVQPRLQPRYKTWLPLVTQQLRLRNLIQIIGFNLRSVDPCWFYYTLHRSTMSSPLYTSEPIDNISPKWSSLEVPTLHKTGCSAATEIIVRVWRRIVKNDPSSDETMFTWGISFTGLMYLGTKLPTDLQSTFHDNSLIFIIQGGYFAPLFSFLEAPKVKRYQSIAVSSSEVRNSYSVSKLSSLKHTMQSLKQRTDSVKNLKEKIASGESLCSPKYPGSSLNRLLQPKRPNREKRQQILSIRKELEVAKFRTKLLEQERVRKMSQIRALNLDHSELVEKNEDYGSALMDKYRELNRDMENLNERRQGYMESKELFVQTSAHLAHRRRQLISELLSIYPITFFSKNADEKYTINNVYLPDSEKLDMSNDTHVAVALGFVTHTTQMVSSFLNVPTRYPMIHYGSRSKIIDHINTNLPDHERQFPLFARSKDKLQFHYAVYLLNKNIAQLRWYCGLPTSDLRATLANLSGIINVRPNIGNESPKRTTSNSSLDTDILKDGRTNFFPNIPLQNTTLACNYQPSISRPINRFKNTKAMQLGASLDQGLNQPFLHFQGLHPGAKRISKSEEREIDEDSITQLSVPKYNSISSDETFIENEFYNSVIIPQTDSDIEGEQEKIEILVPMSVSEPKIDASEEPIECARKRSSNSISSCEMALGSSSVDKTEEIVDSEQSDNLNGIKSWENFEVKETNGSRELNKLEEQEAISLSSTIFIDENDCDLLLNSELTTCSGEEVAQAGEATELTSSLEYIDSVRRSTENVFARTEALANKSCSFKVLRPRL